MIVAYAAVREGAPGHLVLYRVGEFYEVLHEDAAIVSRALGTQLTRRRQKNADDIPMCGIPASTSDVAIGRLLAAGHKVAVSEQPPEGASERPLRLFTPATSVDATVVPEAAANNLAVAHADEASIGFAWIDLSTSETGTCMASLEGCGAALARISPIETLVSRWPEDSGALAVALRSFGAPFSTSARKALAQDETGVILALSGIRDGGRTIPTSPSAAVSTIVLCTTLAET